MSCESHWEENVSFADGNKWRRPASWAFDLEPIPDREIIVKYFVTVARQIGIRVGLEGGTENN